MCPDLISERIAGVLGVLSHHTQNLSQEASCRVCEPRVCVCVALAFAVLEVLTDLVGRLLGVVAKTVTWKCIRYLPFHP